ncbi:hypothetical protein DB30_01788 [Enhygromyxa salina]|uniref:Uncharacterized protein n=1 Tax=Enhygromyxa salina TaxID=215803 RepID=A0A0C2CWM4_9BACT|nr:hypothetical protein DB30_01788 [Enhygromyxa salina]
MREGRSKRCLFDVLDRAVVDPLMPGEGIGAGLAARIRDRPACIEGGCAEHLGRGGNKQDLSRWWAAGPRVTDWLRQQAAATAAGNRCADLRPALEYRLLPAELPRWRASANGHGLRRCPRAGPILRAASWGLPGRDAWLRDDVERRAGRRRHLRPHLPRAHRDLPTRLLGRPLVLQRAGLVRVLGSLLGYVVVLLGPAAAAGRRVELSLPVGLVLLGERLLRARLVLGRRGPSRLSRLRPAAAQLAS